MTRINTAVRFLPEARRNPGVEPLTKEFRARGNDAFLAEVASRLAGASRALSSGSRFLCVGFLGEYGLFGYGTRRAQELVRIDRQPSYWSHVFLVVDELPTDARAYRVRASSPVAWECSLYPADEYALFSQRAGVSPRRLSDYRTGGYLSGRPHCAANIGIVAIEVTEEERARILDAADNPDIDQLRYDLNDLRSVWFRYLASPSNQDNPLKLGLAHHAAAYVQLALDAAGVDLAVGTPQRVVAPEHFWQAATYLHTMVRRVDVGKAPAPRAILGWYCVRDEACLAAPIGFGLETSLRNLVGGESMPPTPSEQ